MPLSSKRLLAIAVTAALLSACSSFQGIESTTQLRAPESFTTATVLPSQQGAWPDQSWVTALGGPALQALVDEGLKENPSLHIAQARIASIQAMAEIAGAAAKPGIGVSANSTYQRFTEHGLVPPPLAGTFDIDNRATVNVGYDFDFWGRHAAELHAVLSQEKSAEAEQHAARLVLTTAIARNWLQLARQSDLLELTEQQVALVSEIERLTRLRIHAGLDNQSDVEQLQLQLASLDVERQRSKEAIALTRNQLAALLGQGPDRGQLIARPILPSTSMVALPDQLPLGLIGRRPDIVAARWRVEATQGEIDTAKTAFYPNINLAGFAGLSSLGLSNLLRSSSAIAGIGPAIQLPIFESGTLRAQLKGKIASYDSAVASYNQSLLEALHEVADQVQSLRAVEQQTSSQGHATDAAARVVKLAEQREQVGTTNHLPVLMSESALLTQRRLTLDANSRHIDLQVGLIKALGGGFNAEAEHLSGADAIAHPNPTFHTHFAKSSS